MISTSFLRQHTNALEGRKIATLRDVAEHLSTSAVKVHHWAKHLPGFLEFSTADQSALIHNHRAAHLLLEIAARSMDCDSLLLGNEFFISTELTAPTQNLGLMIYSYLVEPMRQLRPDEVELNMVKAFLFYDSSEYR